MPTIEERTHHEAAHGVMAHCVGGRFRYITMNPRTDKANALTYGVTVPGQLAMVYVLLAGPLLESAIGGKPIGDVLTQPSGCSDFLKAAALVEQLPGVDLGATIADIDRRFATPTRIRAIQVVAKALLTRTRALTYREFVELVGAL
ncbi:M50 family metallopeptidase [Actinomadura opuntiae]|uniref:M50 family metallopeptidase n=1 Tax=Actinomadura sp. OS1-43 TaxID=604315 RepID=UPI00255AD50F|nr:M50 family metallopeptidase [Actinomadura sp. OS1-43]MDL4815480.1 M50 family metallopeptidase [Actinomadura sp. OS1-43]